jgi:L-ribulose-5-phosphate 3-epimerase
VSNPISRRKLLQMIGVTPVALPAAVAALGHSLPGAAASSGAWASVAPSLQRPLKIGIVSRHLQWAPLEEAIDVSAALGFDAIEWNVRTGGHVDPARVEHELPRVVERTKKAGLAVEMITTSIQDAKSPHVEAILQTASGLGIRHYRGGQYFRYDYARDVWQQLQDLKPRVAALAELNAKYGTTVAYHTHSGAGNIGGNIWDFWEVIKDFEPRVVGLNYDIGHAAARGGSGWIDGAHLVARHITALAVKDARWAPSPKGGWRAEFVPLGDGIIDLKRTLDVLKRVNFDGPINIHYEHNELLGTDLGKWTLPMPRERFMTIVGKDLAYVRQQVREGGL